MSTLQSIWKKLTSPHTTSPYNARREYMTNTILVIMIIVFTITSLIFLPLWIRHLIPWDMPAASVFFTLIFSLGLKLSHRGHLFISSLLPSLFFYLTSIYSTYIYGLSETTILQYSLVIVFTFLMQKGWIQWTAYFVCVLSVFAGGIWSTYQPDFSIYSGDIAYFILIAVIYFLIIILIMKFFVGQYQRALDHSRLYARRLHQEIAEHKQAREKVRASLQEKEVLLKEVHHRVKNNLQVISSLVNLQSRTIFDLELKNKMSELRNRIKSMGLVHNQLYRSNNFSQIDIADYSRDLVDNLIISHEKPDVNVDLKVKPYHFDLNAAVPLGLIINELVTNSFKHGFPSGRKGSIKVTLEKSGGNFELSVFDNGAGFEPKKVLKTNNSLGLNLINTLARQIRGRFEIESTPDNGAEITVTFPEES